MTELSVSILMKALPFNGVGALELILLQTPGRSAGKAEE